MTTPKDDIGLQWLDERKCKKCQVFKPLNQFQKSTQCTSGYRYRCKSCAAKMCRKIYENNPEVKQAKNETYRKNNWDRIKQLSYARRDVTKHKARQAVNNTVKAGKFEKANCQKCSETKTDFHHTDGYEQDKWFVGIWLCRKHHLWLHKELRWTTS